MFGSIYGWFLTESTRVCLAVAPPLRPMGKDPFWVHFCKFGDFMLTC